MHTFYRSQSISIMFAKNASGAQLSCVVQIGSIAQPHSFLPSSSASFLASLQTREKAASSAKRRCGSKFATRRLPPSLPLVVQCSGVFVFLVCSEAISRRARARRGLETGRLPPTTSSSRSPPPFSVLCSFRTRIPPALILIFSSFLGSFIRSQNSVR